MDKGIYVPADGDRFKERREVFGTRRIDVKVSTLDTSGGLFVSEIVDHLKGGPARHLHLEQEEWFYVLEGEYVIEIGDKRYQMGPGESVLAPRKVPHVWAHVGEGSGRLIAAVQPAGKLEEFFDELAKVKGSPSRDRMQELFSAYGMEMAGPPLDIE